MERSKAEAVIEAILFTMGDSVEISRLAEVIEEDVKTTKSILKDMAARYEEENRGIGLTQFDDSVQLCTKADMYEYLIKIAKTPRKMTLTDTVLETLSIIAYKQPVTRLEIERVRGVSCDHAINKLLEYDLITELGRLDAPGRPLLFGTTEQFLRCFGVKSLEELPELNPVQVEEFKQQAEQEVQHQNTGHDLGGTCHSHGNSFIFSVKHASGIRIQKHCSLCIQLKLLCQIGFPGLIPDRVCRFVVGTESGTGGGI